MMTPETALNSQGMFKNSSPNKKLTIYLESQDYVVKNGSADKIQGVLHVQSGELKNMKLLGQVTMIFRYGRDDKEVMGVKSCNEAIVSLTQIYPPHCNHVKQPNSAFQEALIKHLGDYAFPFYLKITHLAPPSIQLVPAKQYYGAPMGTSYDVRAYMENSSRRNTVRMGIRLLRGRVRPQPRLFPSHAPHPTLNALVWLPQPFRLNEESELLEVQSIRDKNPIVKVELGAPRGKIEGPFLLSDGRVELKVCLEKATYCHGETINVHAYIKNHSSKTIQRTKVIVIQHMDVCMYSNGKFKNVVAFKQEYGKPIRPEKAHHYLYRVRPHRGVIKKWIALQDSCTETGATLASTVLCNSESNVNGRNMFAIDVSYYVKVKLTYTEMCRRISVKLPFTLTRSCINEAGNGKLTNLTNEATHKMILEGGEEKADEHQQLIIDPSHMCW